MRVRVCVCVYCVYLTIIHMGYPIMHYATVYNSSRTDIGFQMTTT